MNKLKLSTLFLSVLLVFSGCGTMNNSGKGAGIGAAAGAGLGAIIGAIAGHGKGAAIGAAIGTAVGAGTGAIIGKKMDQKAAEAAKIKNAQVEKVTDSNGLEAVKVTFNSGILFPSDGYTLNSTSRNSLTQFANLLKEDTDTDIAIYGYTDQSLPKNQTQDYNMTLSENRANAVRSFLAGQGVNGAQFKAVQGKGSTESTAIHNANDRKVEIYMYASQEMINKANQQSGN
jgi:outer membrane protein OmpA-like peptidoglycan-associated protein